MKLEPRDVEEALRNSGEYVGAKIHGVAYNHETPSGKSCYYVTFDEHDQDDVRVDGFVFVSYRDGKLWGEF